MTVEESPSPARGEADCAETLRELWLYLDRELTPEHKLRIEQHLDACGDCLQAADFEAELRIVVATKCHEEAPESLRRRIAAAIQAPSRTINEP